jgi:hypothetical protein
MKGVLAMFNDGALKFIVPVKMYADPRRQTSTSRSGSWAGRMGDIGIALALPKGMPGLGAG